MKTKILVLCLFLIPAMLYTKGIQKAEYYFDNEPGVGLGTALQITGGNEINVLDSINAPNLDYGFHSLNFRFMDSSGNWGFIKSIPFYVFNDSINNNQIIRPIVSLEYFFDIDSGIGNCTKINLTKSDTLTYLDSLSNKNLDFGFHNLNIRMIDSTGNMGFSKSIPFYVFNDSVSNNKILNPIVSLEYFFDNDNGIGNCTKINLTKSDTLTYLDSLSNKNLDFGFHNLNIRMIDSTGKMGFSKSIPFYVFNDSVSNNKILNPIVSLEYFFDNDNGIGNGTKINLTKSDTLTYLDSLSNKNLDFGFHNLNIRMIDSTGKMGFSKSIPFYVFNDSVLNNQIIRPIVALEYFIGKNDPGIGNGIKVDIKDSIIVESLVWNPVSNLQLGPEKLSVRLIDSLGKYSFVNTKDFTVCEIDGPEAGFDYIKFGNEVTFLDTSYNAVKWLWDFGDKKKDSIASPKHVYDTAGVMNVKLIAYNSCGIDTITGQVEITGLQSYNPTKGGNSGKVTMLLYGIGFSDSTIVKLLDSTQSTIKEISPDNISWNSTNPNVLKAIFNLNNKPVGLWDIFLDKLNDKSSKQYRKSKAFTIELGEKPDPYIDITGNSRIRFGIAQTYTVTFGNRANIDAAGTVFFIALQGDTTLDVSFDFDFAKPDSILNFDSIPMYFTPSSLNGKPFFGRIYPVFVPLIQANSNFSAKMKIKTKSNVTISGWANPPMFSENLKQIAYRNEDEIQGSAGSDVTECIVNYAMEKANDAIDEAFEVLPGYTCVNTYIESWNSIYDYNSENYLFDKPIGVIGNLLWNLSKITVDCIADFVPAGKYKKIADFVKKTVEFATEVQEGFEDGQNMAKCASAFTKLAIQELPPIIAVSSFDPNEKSGPGSGETAKWARSDKEFSYSILYENKASATAAAQVVTIYDTLSKASLDFSTFQLKTFECGNITRYVPPGLKEYSTDIDLRPNKDLILRINGKLDTNSGIAKWEYISLDPKTRSLTDSVDLGFLNPNVIPPEGEGKVTYSVRPKKNLSNNIEIRNKAQILFDANEPILTNDWKIRIDNNKAQSAVTALKPVIFDSTFVVDWSSNDAVGDVLMTVIFVSTNDGPYYLWSQNIDTNSAVFKGKFGSKYKFYSIAVDYAGNIEGSKTNNDTYTTLKKLMPPILVSPGNNQQYVNYKAAFDWDDAEDAESYEIQVSKTSDFSNIVFEKQNILTSNIDMIPDSLIYLTDYFWRVRTVNGTVISQWSEIFKFKTQGEPEIVPDSWKYEDSTGKHAIVKIPYDSKPKIGNRDILTGDAIGLFFTRNDSMICAGYNIWNESDIEVTVWGDDEETPIKDGFAENEKYRVFIWDAQQHVQRETIVDYSSGNDFFLDGGYSVLSALITNVTQEIVLNQGWNMVSSYIYPDTTQLENLLADNSSNIIIMKNSNGEVYIPSYNINYIGGWKTTDGYLIYMQNPDSFKITGTPAIPEESSIPLKSGWNIISYLRDAEMDCETAFAGLTDNNNLIIVKDNFGNVYIPAYGINTIGNLIPGQGYQIYITNTDELVYPGN
jgi:hypothetical protein